MSKVTSKKKVNEYELIESAKIFVEAHLDGRLTPLQLQKKLNNYGLNYTKINRPNQTNVIFVIRGKGIDRTELKF